MLEVIDAANNVGVVPVTDWERITIILERRIFSARITWAWMKTETISSNNNHNNNNKYLYWQVQSLIRSNIKSINQQIAEALYKQWFREYWSLSVIHSLHFYRQMFNRLQMYKQSSYDSKKITITHGFRRAVDSHGASRCASHRCCHRHNYLRHCFHHRYHQSLYIPSYCQQLGSYFSRCPHQRCY